MFADKAKDIIDQFGCSDIRIQFLLDVSEDEADEMGFNSVDMLINVTEDKEVFASLLNALVEYKDIINSHEEADSALNEETT